MGMSASREASSTASPSLSADLHVSSGVSLSASVQHLEAQLRDVMVCYRGKCKAQALEPNANIVSTLQSFPHGARLQVCKESDHEENGGLLSVTSIDLSFNKITAEGAIAVFEVVASLHSVVELLMDGNRIGDAFSCMRSSPNLSSLRTLSLRTNRIRHLDRFPALPALTTLLLDGNDLGDSMKIACLAGSCPALESLSLTWCSIKNLSRACAALSNLPKLRVLAFQ
ncbi:hypothetical protein T484DRAFT_1776971, partial [Baffinella frigidus]